MGWCVGLLWVLMRTWDLCSLHSLGVVLSQGHGEYILLGNTSVEEGESAPSTDGQFRGEMDAPGMLSRANPRQRWFESLPDRGLESSLWEQGCLVRRGLCVSGTRSVRPANQPSKRQSLTALSDSGWLCGQRGLKGTCF